MITPLGAAAGRLGVRVLTAGVASATTAATSRDHSVGATGDISLTLPSVQNLWMKEWRLQEFQLEFDLAEFSHCRPLASAPHHRISRVLGRQRATHGRLSRAGGISLPSGVRTGEVTLPNHGIKFTERITRRPAHTLLRRTFARGATPQAQPCAASPGR